MIEKVLFVHNELNETITIERHNDAAREKGIDSERNGAYGY